MPRQSIAQHINNMNKQSIPIIVLLFVLSLSQMPILWAQNNSINISYRSSNNNKCTFDVNQNTSINQMTGQMQNDLTFLLFGDGDFAYVVGDQLVDHVYPTGQSYVMNAYKAKKNDPIDPFVANSGSVQIIGQNSQGMFRNPSLNTGGNYKIKSSRSWDYAPATQNFLIITLDQAYNGSDVYLHFDQQDFYVTNHSNITSTTSSNPFWEDNRHQNLLSTKAELLANPMHPNYDQTLKISNIVYKNGQQTHLFVRLYCNNTSRQKLTHRVELKDGYDLIGSYAASARKKAYPHDPNSIEVNKQEIDSPVCMEIPLVYPYQEELIYTVNFHNEGDFFAEDIEILAFLLDPNLNAPLTHVVDKSHHCPQTLLRPHMDEAQFNFECINLPGLQQMDNNSFYAYEETCGSVSFSVKTYGTHVPGEMIHCFADIVFIGGGVVMPPIMTNQAITNIIDCGYDITYENPCCLGVVGNPCGGDAPSMD